jgi:thiamine phosphate synthase YjbQ (UPF0047 family)
MPGRRRLRPPGPWREELHQAITRGLLDCGPWEQIFYGELDGRRDKRVLIKIIGD